MEKKYEMFKENETDTIYRIRALRDFGDVKKGDLGGQIEKEENLSHDGNCWVFPRAMVCNDAKVYGNAQIISGNIFMNAEVYDNATVDGFVMIYENAKIYGQARIIDNTMVYGNAQIFGHARIQDYARVYGDARVNAFAIIAGQSCVYGDARVTMFNVVPNGHCVSDLTENITESIRCQTGLMSINGKVIAYRRVKDISSDTIVEKSIDISEYNMNVLEDVHSLCHVCFAFTDSRSDGSYNTDIIDTYIQIVEIDLNDILSVQNGNIYCCKYTVLDHYKI